MPSCRRLGVRLAGDQALRVLYPMVLASTAMVDEPGEPEVTELGVEGRVQHDVARLDVPMYHTLLPLFVQVEEGRPQAQHDLVPSGMAEAQCC